MDDAHVKIDCVDGSRAFEGQLAAGGPRHSKYAAQYKSDDLLQRAFSRPYHLHAPQQRPTISCFGGVRCGQDAICPPRHCVPVRLPPRLIRVALPQRIVAVLRRRGTQQARLDVLRVCSVKLSKLLKENVPGQPIQNNPMRGIDKPMLAASKPDEDETG